MHSALSPQHPTTVAAVVASCRSDAWRFAVEAAPGSRSHGVGRRGSGRGWPQCVAPRHFGCTWPSPRLCRSTLQQTTAASMRRAASQQRPVIVDAAVASSAAEVAGRRLQCASPLQTAQMRQGPGSNAWHGVAAGAFCRRRHPFRHAIAGQPHQRYEVHRGPPTAGARTTRNARHRVWWFCRPRCRSGCRAGNPSHLCLVRGGASAADGQRRPHCHRRRPRGGHGVDSP